MRDALTQSRDLQVALKITALICGSILLLVSAHSGSASLSFDVLFSFIASQTQSTQQLQWLFGLIFLSAGIFFMPIRIDTRKSLPFSGSKELGNDSYVLYLVGKYKIEKNLVLDQLIVRDRIFSNVDDALAFAHAIECPTQIGVQVAEVISPELPVPIVEDLGPQFETQNGFAESLRNPFAQTPSSALSTDYTAWSDAKRNKVTLILGALLFVIVLGGLFYANSHSARNIPQSAVIEPTPPFSQTANSDQVVSGSIASQDANTVSNTSEAKEVGKLLVAMPINERWIGLWVPESAGKQKLLVTASLMKFGDEEFSWAGVRPKGIVQCCLAFYEGATTKADLIARISGAQDPGASLKPESQKTMALLSGLSEGNFKRIVFADPYLKKYFFIYDQNYVYRISRDLGDKADVVVEQFKKQE
ncbi:hypothetical protein [Polynucleobacter sp. MWH-UH2A]|uniref:hypothetical protein n=1 Tax=Polynucleobacter sp. MWH-UH2A TaxID=1855617 RepID=UPI001BFEABD0|nr:hypothetical protein [Polynucleobacter sp. MWH-UH2A]QWD64672.1 hypothetical protein IC571_03305 [Polynucleobacter sp. MWH-UH2A]